MVSCFVAILINFHQNRKFSAAPRLRFPVLKITIYAGGKKVQTSSLPISDNCSSQLAGNAYFDNLVRIMAKARYDLVSKVLIDSNDHAFHVPVDYARATSLFFRLRSKKFVVQMTYHESFYPDGRRQAYWSINLYLVFLPVATLVKNIHGRIGKKYFDEEPLARVPLLGKELAMPGTKFVSYRNGVEVHVDYWLSEEQSADGAAVVRNLLQALFEVEQYVAYGKFRQLQQVTSFVPYSSFPEAHATFWRRFGLGALYEITSTPWGGEVAAAPSK